MEATKLERVVMVTCLLLMGCSALLNSSAHAAQPGATQQIMSSITLERLQAIMKEEGYSVNRDPSGPLIWKIDGRRSLLLIADDGESIQFAAAFGDGNATLKKVNEWNQTKRYSKSYLDEDGDPVLELDLDLAGGVTKQRLTDYLRTCHLSYQAWISEVIH